MCNFSSEASSDEKRIQAAEGSVIWKNLGIGTLLETNILFSQGTLEDDVPFRVCWDMLVPARVI